MAVTTEERGRSGKLGKTSVTLCNRKCVPVVWSQIGHFEAVWIKATCVSPLSYWIIEDLFPISPFFLTNARIVRFIEDIFFLKQSLDKYPYVLIS